ncbi:hypothetical protein BD311DRAFT_762205 [Dichomitus squalens]|uniref:Uncharacterized protein n=1 Tax=Dichomitus squalens TaxID=114155 RepID=A0A4V2JZW7_9APHY|nr:hypothetical protein BD311DRAFT_762205 [Dichomitus squalens]
MRNQLASARRTCMAWLEGLSSPPSQELRSRSNLDKVEMGSVPLRPYGVATQRLHSCSWLPTHNDNHRSPPPRCCLP